MLRSKGVKITAILLAVVLGLCAVALTLLPNLVSYAAKKSLHDLNFNNVDLGNIDLNLFTGELLIHSFLADEMKERGIDFDELHVHFALRPLTSQIVALGRISLTGLDVRMQQRADGSFSVGYEAATEDATSTQTDAEVPTVDATQPWLIELDSLTLSDSTVQVFNQDGSAKLTWTFDMELNDFSSDTLGNITFKKFTLSNGKLVIQDHPTIAHREIVITDFNLSESALSFDALTIADLRASIVRQADGMLSVVEAISQFDGVDPETSATLKAAQAIEEDMESGDLAWSFNSIALEGDNQIHFLDQSITPTLDKTLTLSRFSIGAVNSKKPDTLTPIDIEIDGQNQDSITIDGKLSPLLAAPNADLSVIVSELELTQLSPYAEDAIGYNIQTGYLNLESKTTVEKGNISSNNTLVLNKLALVQSNSEKAAETNSKLQIPLNTALGILQDSNDDIELAIPVNGSMEDPEFDIGPAVRGSLVKAISSASLTYIQYAVQPWGAALFIGKQINNFAGRVTFEPVVFEPGSADLDKDMQEYLEKVSKLLQDREKLRITACSVTNEQDLTALAKHNKDSAKDAAGQLAETRFNIVKDFLVVQQNIDSGRIIKCLSSQSVEQNSPSAVLLSL